MPYRYLLALMLLVACADDTAETDDGGVNGEDGAAGGEPKGPPLNEVPCIDQSITQLGLFEEPAPGAVREEEEIDGALETTIDATGGGMTPTTSFVYGRFTEDGFEQLDLSDEEAFESGAWQIAMRRYVVRLNGGVAGPGAITVARTAPNTDFYELDATPDGLDYRTEEYFTESCDFVSDGSGIGAPATALASFWSYSGCVEMTGNVYVVELEDGRHVKLQVLAYYTLENQAICDETGKVPSPSGAGFLRIRWAFLD
jgi:hypothetical protein